MVQANQKEVERGSFDNHTHVTELRSESEGGKGARCCQDPGDRPREEF